MTVVNLEQSPGPVELIKVLGVIATVSGILIVGAYQMTAGARSSNQQKAREAAVFQVVPGAVSYTEYALTAETVTPILSAEVAAPEGSHSVFVGYNASGEMAGIALEAGAQGYSDIVKILYNYSPSCECVTGFTVLSSRETPGLGDKIITNDNFQANFKNPGLEAKLNAEKTALANEIVTVKHGTKTHPWQVDAISGATITSRAVGKGINQSAKVALPLVAKHLDSMKTKPEAKQGSAKTEDREVK